ncbi:aminopeptidase N [Tistrella bauzanensis]|uniref:Aminopeptidase N n=1 Tax=Tistrella arctica TaxID=3133430 RepID=A0ABU9YDH0_9PROT
MKTDLPKTILLAEYAPPAYQVSTIDLEFRLDPHATRVTATSRFDRMAGAAADAPLVLDGAGLRLVSIMIDGAPVGPDRYDQQEERLVIRGVPAGFVLTVITEIDPAGNTALEGLYQSNGIFCTQCEAEGFRKITYFPDRPDVMARYRTTIIGDPVVLPVMLSNGNPVADETGPDGLRRIVWEDPFPKPSYLFALVAGDLALHEDSFTTISGRSVALRLYVEPRNADKCAHAMASLKKALAWDETAYGREYDLDIYMIVAVDDFNMGAMENKGLNVFNSKYILARPDTATDADYAGIEAVVAHEYFHNWTGNRITCRDWFQLSLKEGLTVFREQQFVADHQSAAVSRIHDVRVLRAAQFPEDAGPTAHPVRPDSYIEISNFYTSTVYNKGAEVIRMLHTLIGEDAYRRGMDLYFQRHDGQAVTCEDFIRAHADANDLDLGDFFRWYVQAGTPEVSVDTRHDPDAGTFDVTFTQTLAPTPGQPVKQPMVVPVRAALIGPDGAPLPMMLANEPADAPQAGALERVLVLSDRVTRFTFMQLPERPVPSLLRGFSAPVKLDTRAEDADLAFLMGHDDDPFNRWEAAQTYAIRVIHRLIADIGAGRPLVLPLEFREAFTRTITDDALDPALVAEALTLPGESYLAETMSRIDVEGITTARQFVRREIGRSLEPQLIALFDRLEAAEAGQPYAFETAAVGRRSLANLCLAYLGAAGGAAGLERAERRFATATNMTDALGGLLVLADQPGELSQPAFDAFYDRWKDEPLVVDKWFMVQATASRPDALDHVLTLMEHPAFSMRNPNRVRSLIGAFAASNPQGFHAADGRGYEFLADQIVALDAMNPQIAARLVGPFKRWRRYDDRRQGMMRAALERIMSRKSLSRDVYEMVTKSLA